MKEDYSWVLITIAMIVTIIVLHGCTRLDTQNANIKYWDIEFESLPTGECSASINVSDDTNVSDESIEITNPRGG